MGNNIDEKENYLLDDEELDKVSGGLRAVTGNADSYKKECSDGSNSDNGTNGNGK